MEIAIINCYQNKVNRGAEIYVAELGKRLSRNHHVDILNNINFLKRYDLIIPTNGRLQVFVVRILTWLTGSKMIVSGQSGIGWDDRLNLYAFPDYFIPLTNYAKKWADKMNPFTKKQVISNGVDLEKFKIKNLKSVTGSAVKIKNNYKTVLCVGAFTDEKRHDLTIRAVSKIPNAKLIIVAGGGDKKEKIVTLGKKILDNRFRTLSLSHDEVGKIYNEADVFVYPTVPWESFGIVLVEAMASGLAVVASDDPIRREIVGDAGLFVDPTDTNAYSKAIEKALNTNWGDKPRKQAEKFSWDKIALQYEELFKRL